MTNVFAHAIRAVLSLVINVKRIIGYCIGNMTPTKKFYKQIRKWARLRSLDYKTCKHMYDKLSIEEKEKMQEEVTEYIDAVASGSVTPSKPTIPNQPQMIQ
ncbi:MAG: hypothetical protein KGI08_01910 [Thaumarchaeota archaeon]|nr:hypothetical protein [Nitrososphaerota archaeon]